jgi:hypothetical protein
MTGKLRDAAPSMRPGSLSAASPAYVPRGGCVPPFARGDHHPTLPGGTPPTRGPLPPTGMPEPQFSGFVLIR